MPIIFAPPSIGRNFRAHCFILSIVSIAKELPERSLGYDSDELLSVFVKGETQVILAIPSPLVGGRNSAATYLGYGFWELG